MASPTSDAPESPQNGQEWLSVSEAAARLGISTKTLRKRMARGEVAFRRVILARGGAAYEVELETVLEHSKPMFQTEGKTGTSKFQTASPKSYISRGVSSVKSPALETEMEGGLEYSISPSKPMPESSKPTSKPALEMESEVARLRADLERERESAAFLRGVIEQLQRDGAEVRAALRKALELAPKQLPAPSPVAPDESARIERRDTKKGAARTYGPDVLEGAKTGGKSDGAGVSYASIADELEKMLNR